MTKSPGRRPRAWPTVVASIALFAVCFTLLAFQLRAGHAPTLGAAGPTRPAKAAPVSFAASTSPPPVTTSTS